MKTSLEMAAARVVKLTPKLRSAIYQAAKRHVRGSAPLFEAGLRYVYAETPNQTLTMNMRIWERDPAEPDLWEMARLANLKVLHLDEEGLCELDLYATTTLRPDTRPCGGCRELETNVYVLTDGERVLSVRSV